MEDVWHVLACTFLQAPSPAIMSLSLVAVMLGVPGGGVTLLCSFFCERTEPVMGSCAKLYN
jgi:hypothetical protein